MNKLSPESTLRDCFDYFDGVEGELGAVQVVPVTIKQQSDDTQLCIFIKGDHATASVIMAELMTKVDELFAYSKQADAIDVKSPIITP